MDEAVAAVLRQLEQGATARDLESDVVDFKTVGRSTQDALRDLAEAAMCFANARGGTVVVGVRDGGAGVDAYVGCQLDVGAVKRRIFELTEPSLVVPVEEVVRVGKRLLMITTPASSEVHSVQGRSTERLEKSCEPMSTSRIATVVADRRGDDWSALDTGIPADSVNPLAVAQARAMLERATDERVRQYSRSTDQDLLRRLGLVAASGSMNRAGALLLTEQWETQEHVNYIYRRTPAGALLANEHLGGPLLTALERALDFVDARLDRTSLNLPGGQQLQVADLPEPAVREAIVNGIMHRDYRRPGTVQIEHTATRLVVTSPGPLVDGVTVDNLLTTSSRPRNSVLARAIRILGLAETAGAGVDRMYVEMTRVGHQPPTFAAELSRVVVTLLGGAPNAAIARFVAGLPAGEADDADTMLVLLALLQQKTINAQALAPVLQKNETETVAVLERLAVEPVMLTERTRETARRALPKYRLREDALAALGSAVSYRRRTADEYDRKITGLLAETDAINARMVRLMLDLDVTSTSRVLADLVERGILVKTSEAQRGPSVTYGRGPKFPKKRTRSKRKVSSARQLSLDDE